LIKSSDPAADGADRGEGRPHQPGEPELPSEQIQAKIEKDRALWYKHADGLKTAAVEAVRVAKTAKRC